MGKHSDKRWKSPSKYNKQVIQQSNSWSMCTIYRW